MKHKDDPFDFFQVPEVLTHNKTAKEVRAHFSDSLRPVELLSSPI
jgi:hypothetical protein